MNSTPSGCCGQVGGQSMNLMSGTSYLQKCVCGMTGNVEYACASTPGAAQQLCTSSGGTAQGAAIPFSGTCGPQTICGPPVPSPFSAVTLATSEQSGCQTTACPPKRRCGILKRIFGRGK
ncbi:MAG: hypothetical protein ACE361_20620 [Aureliella sp.]